jgi:hypothetical protein
MAGTAVQVKIFLGIDGPEKSEATDDHRGEGREWILK